MNILTSRYLLFLSFLIQSPLSFASLGDPDVTGNYMECANSGDIVQESQEEIDKFMKPTEEADRKEAERHEREREEAEALEKQRAQESAQIFRLNKIVQHRAGMQALGQKVESPAIAFGGNDRLTTELLVQEKILIEDYKTLLANFKSPNMDDLKFLDSEIAVSSLGRVTQASMITVRAFIHDLTDYIATNGKHSRIVSIEKNDNIYTLKADMQGDMAVFSLVHDLSPLSDGEGSVLESVSINGSTGDPLIYLTEFHDTVTAQRNKLKVQAAYASLKQGMTKDELSKKIAVIIGGGDDTDISQDRKDGCDKVAELLQAAMMSGKKPIDARRPLAVEDSTLALSVKERIARGDVSVIHISTKRSVVVIETINGKIEGYGTDTKSGLKSKEFSLNPTDEEAIGLFALMAVDGDWKEFK